MRERERERERGEGGRQTERRTERGQDARVVILFCLFQAFTLLALVTGAMRDPVES